MVGALEVDEEMLSLDLCDSDYLYRIRRRCRIVYVSVQPTLIPLEDRSYGPRVLFHLRGMPLWDQAWQTLTITEAGGAVSSAVDQFEPHAVSYEWRAEGLQNYNILSLKRVAAISNRISVVRHGTESYVMKIARFDYEISYLTNEIRIYDAMQSKAYAYVPLIIGFVYEEDQKRRVGFLMQHLEGSHPLPGDISLCRNAIETLHQAGVAHGDLNKYNMIIGDRGLKFIDFEASKLTTDDGFEQMRQLDLATLEERLNDTSGVGDRGV